MNLLKSINEDIAIYHGIYQKLITTIIIFVYKLRNKINKHIYWYLICGLIIFLINNELNKNKVTLSTEYDNKYKIIRIKNSKKIPFKLSDGNILKYIDENNAHIEKYRSIMEEKYITRYFETLKEGYKFNY